jgi:hypothetical protein
MLTGIGIVRIADFESPDMVSQFRAADQFHFGQVGQIPEDGRFVKTERNEPVGQFGMGHGRGGGPELTHHGDARRRSPQSGGTQQLADFLNLVRVALRFPCCHVSFPYTEWSLMKPV